MSGSVHHVIPLRKASKILHLFNLHPSWWSILSVFVLNMIRLSKTTSFSSAFLTTPFRSESLTAKKFLFATTTLVATINHWGSLNNCHYWAIIKDDTANQWFSCNDKVAFDIKADDLITKYMCSFVWKNDLVFIFISVIFMEGGFVNWGNSDNLVCSLNFQGWQPCSP